MNEERFRELARQAGILIDWGEDIKVGRWGIGGNYKNMQKFAELIVRECANMAESFHHHQYDFTGNLELHEFIKEYFGVEE